MASHHDATLPLVATNGSPQPHPTHPAIQVEGLNKRYGSINAVRDVSFEVKVGEVFGFLGPNGAGKSTTIKMLCTLTKPTSGKALVAGFDSSRQPRAVRRHIALVFQDQTLDEHLTAEENLRFHAVLYRVPREVMKDRIDHVLELVGLADRRRDLVMTYSGGMARRLEIARSLLHNPQVLFLDEPTVGLDPQTRVRLWEDVLRLRDEQNLTVFLTTHYLEEAEYADRIAIIDRGTIVASGTPSALKAAVGTDTVELTTPENDVAVQALLRAGHNVQPTAEGLRVHVPSGERAAAQLVSIAGVDIHQLRMRQPTLDDVFMHFTGREIREERGDPNAAVRRFAASRRR